MLRVTATLHVPLSEVEFQYARSSGPGGQNVNKVNSKAVLRWRPFESEALSLDQKTRFHSRFGTRLTVSRELVLSSDRFRDQAKNRDDCIEKLRAMLLQIAEPPRPRKKTKVSRAAKQRRTDSKRRHGEKKRLRSRTTRGLGD